MIDNLLAVERDPTFARRRRRLLNHKVAAEVCTRSLYCGETLEVIPTNPPIVLNSATYNALSSSEEFFVTKLQAPPTVPELDDSYLCPPDETSFVFDPEEHDKASKRARLNFSDARIAEKIMMRNLKKFTIVDYI